MKSFCMKCNKKEKSGGVKTRSWKPSCISGNTTITISAHACITAWIPVPCYKPPANLFRLMTTEISPNLLRWRCSELNLRCFSHQMRRHNSVSHFTPGYHTFCHSSAGSADCISHEEI